jgi:hypothetical protein
MILCFRNPCVEVELGRSAALSLDDWGACFTDISDARPVGFKKEKH